MRIAGTCLASRSVGRVLPCDMFLPRRGAAGSSLGAPRLLCGASGMFGEMVE